MRSETVSKTRNRSPRTPVFLIAALTLSSVPLAGGAAVVIIDDFAGTVTESNSPYSLEGLGSVVVDEYGGRLDAGSRDDIEYAVDTVGDGLAEPAKVLAARKFSPGERIDASVFGDGGTTPVFIYGIEGTWEVGETAFAGFRRLMIDGNGWFYGWIELTRGSLTVGQIGFNSEPNQGVPTPGSAVPVPPALFLMLGGLVALGLVSRSHALRVAAQA
jgi:hypothetical protein